MAKVWNDCKSDGSMMFCTCYFEDLEARPKSKYSLYNNIDITFRDNGRIRY
jgi:hypothetical protein